jgi:hypothetical protein
LLPTEGDIVTFKIALLGGAAMNLELRAVLALACVVGTLSQTVAAPNASDDETARPAEHSLVKTAIDDVSALAKAVAPVQLSESGPADGPSADKAPATVVWVHLSKDYLRKYVERDVDHKKPARENVLGIVFTGDSRTSGKTRLVLRPDAEHATADIEFTGTVHSFTVGHTGPATLQYTGESTFRARKQLVVGDDGMTATKAVVTAPTRLIPISVATNLPGLRGRIGNRIAQRREAGSRGQAEAIVSRDTANDIRHDFDTKLEASLADIQTKVKAQIAALKLNGQDGAVAMRSRSTADFIEVALCPRSGDGRQFDLVASSPFDGNPNCSVCVHRSVIPALLANAELRETLAPMFTSALAINENSEHAASAPRFSMNGDWISLDLTASNSPVLQTPSRMAATQGLTSR